MPRTMYKREMKKKIRNDIILILAPLLLCIGYAVWVMYSHQAGGYVYIEQAGEKVGIYPLNEDREILIGDKDGYYNVLVIKDGRVDMTEASCPDKICVNHRKIAYEGERIVCLPNRLIVRVEKDGKQADIAP